MDSGGSNKQMKVIFSGRVQGVGFRYTTCNIARPLNLTGSVRNLMYGDVELIAEGSKQKLIDFLNTIRASELGHHIVQERLKWAEATGKYENFGILF